LTERSKTILSGFADYLNSNENLRLAINGHTDDVGDNEKNRILSQNRSDAVKQFLIEKGVSDSRLKAVGYGESKPKVTNNSESNRAKNRRTEFEIIGL
jgi:outer membrane protein OmpA-like peptidoglycan-associated protein